MCVHILPEVGAEAVAEIGTEAGCGGRSRGGGQVRCTDGCPCQAMQTTAARTVAAAAAKAEPRPKANQPPGQAAAAPGTAPAAAASRSCSPTRPGLQRCKGNREAA